MYDLAVFIGRFQPFHAAHQAVLEEGLRVAQRVMVLIGSSFEPRSLRNPWTYAEREAMIRGSFSKKDNEHIICEPLRDIRYNNALWITQVQRAVYNFMPGQSKEIDEKVTLIGRIGGEENGRRNQSYYTSLFPQWGNSGLKHDFDIYGTMIRDHIFSSGSVADIGDDLAVPVLEMISQFMTEEGGQTLSSEYEFIKAYKKGWENVPFEPTHVTVDAVVVQSGHVLLVQRGAQPGKGLLALPGGFIHHEESLLDAMVRKLKEETKLKVPAPVIKGSVKDTAVFDAPFRSARGRTITHAFHIGLRSEEELPRVKGGGETSRCFWLPLGQLDSTQMFEDHYFIIQKMLGLL